MMYNDRNLNIDYFEVFGRKCFILNNKDQLHSTANPIKVFLLDTQQLAELIEFIRKEL